MSTSFVFPFFQTDTPATDEYQRAFQKYGEGVDVGNGPPVGWTAGKLLEKAARALPEPPTSEAILAGLWTVRNDNLGGLTYPLSFLPDRPSEPRSCWFLQVIKDKTWRSPDNFQCHCL